MNQAKYYLGRKIEALELILRKPLSTDRETVTQASQELMHWKDYYKLKFGHEYDLRNRGK